MLRARDGPRTHPAPSVSLSRAGLRKALCKLILKANIVEESRPLRQEIPNWFGYVLSPTRAILPFEKRAQVTTVLVFSKFDFVFASFIHTTIYVMYFSTQLL